MPQTSRPMRLGIDLDGVIANFNDGWIERYNREFGTTIDPASVTFWDGIHTLTHFDDMDEFWVWSVDLDGASLFRHLTPYPGSIEALRTLADAGHQIVILSHKPDFAIWDTYAWLAEHQVPTREVHLIESKWDIGCDLYLDDADHNLKAYRLHRPDRIICRYVQPWNNPVDGVVDIAEWSDLFQLTGV